MLGVIWVLSLTPMKESAAAMAILGVRTHRSFRYPNNASYVSYENYVSYGTDDCRGWQIN